MPFRILLGSDSGESDSSIGWPWRVSSRARKACCKCGPLHAAGWTEAFAAIGETRGYASLERTPRRWFVGMQGSHPSSPICVAEKTLPPEIAEALSFTQTASKQVFALGAPNRREAVRFLQQAAFAWCCAI